MSANSAVIVVSLLVGATAMTVGVAALSVARGLHRRLATMQDELATHHADAAAALTALAAVPHARTAAQAEEIRAAVTAALADERERELAEARAFWAAQEAHEAADAPLLDTRDLRDLRDLRDALDARDARGFDSLAAADPGSVFDSGDTGEPAERGEYGEQGESGENGPYGEFEVSPYFPRPVDLVGLESDASLPAARRHPSDPDFQPSPVIADPEQTVARLASLADARTPLSDIRPGPLGTLDLYIFADGTTLCLTPGHRETAERLAAALDRGEAPVLLGGSGVSGAFSLTFAYGHEQVFILADRVVASF